MKLSQYHGPDQIMSEFVNICLQKFRSIKKKVIEKNENFQGKNQDFEIFDFSDFFSTVNIVTDSDSHSHCNDDIDTKNEEYRSIPFQNIQNY